VEATDGHGRGPLVAKPGSPRLPAAAAPSSAETGMVQSRNRSQNLGLSSSAPSVAAAAAAAATGRAGGSTSMGPRGSPGRSCRGWTDPRSTGGPVPVGRHKWRRRPWCDAMDTDDAMFVHTHTIERCETSDLHRVICAAIKLEMVGKQFAPMGRQPLGAALVDKLKAHVRS
jgi:hypothetical protein